MSILLRAVYGRGAFLTLAALLAVVAAPVAQAYDLQFAYIRDDQSPAPGGSDPTPAGGTIVYDIRIENSGADSVSDVQTVFDVPAGTTPVSLPGNCTLRAGPPDQVVCTHGALVGTLAPTPGSPVDFQLQFQTTVAGTVTLRAAIGVGTPPATALPLTPPNAFFGTDTNTANNNSSQATTVTSGADLAISKVDTPDPVNGGDRITYSITVSNNGPNAANVVRVRDTLSSSTSYVTGSASGAGWSFSFASGVLTATRAAGLANGASSGFTYEATVNVGSGSVANSAVVDTNGGTADFDPNNNTAIANTAVNPGADASISKLVSATPVAEGDTVTFTLRPRNAGPSAITSAVVTDALPAGFNGVSITSSPNWTCAFSGAGNAQLDCTRAAFPVGATDNIVFTATTATGVPGTGQIFTNTGTISSATPDPSLPNNSGSVNVTVLPDGADLQITSKSRDRSIVTIGAGAASQVRSTIVVRNNGPRAVSSNLVVTDELEASETYVSSSGPWSCAAAGAPEVVTCTFTGTYPVNAGTTLSGGNALVITTEVIAADSDVVNTACVGGSGGSAEPVTPGPDLDPNTTNDCTGPGNGTTGTTQAADLALAKASSTPTGGDKIVSISESSVTYTLTVTNNGPDATTGIVITDPLPGYRTGTPATPAATFDLTGAAGWTCADAGGTVTCRSGTTSLASGASATVGITVQRPLNDSAGNNATCNGATQPNAFCNTAVVATDRAVAGALGDNDFSDNTAEDHVTVERVSNVRTTANVVSPGTTGQIGVNSTFRIDYLNAGPSVARDVIYRATISLPASDTGFVLTNVLNSGGTACTVTPGTGITTAAGAGGTSYANPSGSASEIVIRCGALAMSNQNAQNLQITLRPNFGATGPYTAVGDFTFPGDTSTGSDAQGAWEYNSVPGAADDERSETLTLSADQINLLTNKTDLADPVGFDPSDFANNLIVYRVTVRNLGPSVASSVVIDDTITPPAGKTLRYLGASTASAGPFAPARCAQTSGVNPSTGAAMGFNCVMPGAGFTPNVDGAIGVNQVSELFLAFQYETAPNGTGDTLSNTATASAAETDADLSNNTDAEDTTIRSRADLSVGKFAVLTAPNADPTVALPANAPSVTLRQPFFYVVEGINNGPGLSLSRDRSGTNPLNGTGTVVTDSLPIGLRITGPATWQKVGDTLGGAFPDASGSGTCTPPAAIPFTVAPGAQTFACNVGDLTFITGTPGRVRVIIPAEWVAYPPAATGTVTTVTNGAAIATEQIDPVPGNNGTTRDTDVTRATLAGTVFQDRDRAGANGGTPQAAGTEPRLSGVAIALTGTDAYGNAVSLSATTDASGNYSFGNLAPSNAAGYTVTQTQPAGFSNGPVDPPAFGTANGPSLTAGTPTYSRPDATGNTVYGGIVVGTNEAGVRYHFPELRRPSLSGVVYIDRNFNDVFNSGVDEPIPGATVNLYDAANAGTVLATTTTDGGGAYSFTNLDPLLTYVVEEPLPTSPSTYLNRPTAVNPGLVGGAACVGCAAAPNTPAANTDRITGIDLSSGQDGTQFNFGEDEEAGTGISGFVYVDRNNSGSFENGGADAGTVNSRPNGGLQGVTITLTGPGGPVVVLTDANGRYAFTNLVAGANYTVTQTQPSGYANGTQNPTGVIAVTALPVGGSSGNNFGERLGSLAGSVYADFSSGTPANTDNGARDAGEAGIAGVVVTLTGTDANGAVNRTFTSDASGNFNFSDLLEGTYQLAEGTIPPAAGTFNDGRDAAGNGTPPGNASAVNDRISGIGITAGQSATGYLFGELPVASISGIVYIDANRDNALGGTDTGRIGGVTLAVTLGNTCPGTALQTITTAADGSYSFAGLSVGQTYTVCQTQPAGYGNGNANGTPGSNAITVTNLPLAGVTGQTFGELVGSLAGLVYLDSNNNGVRDGGEPAIPGVVMTLSGTTPAGNVTLTATTAADGSYRFDALLGGTYAVTQQATQPVVGGVTTIDGVVVAGSTGGTATATGTSPSAITAITLPAAADSTANTFAETLPVSISGRVYLDANNNGVIDAGEQGIANQLIRITGTDDRGQPVGVDLTTQPGGDFSATGLRPGTYTVTQPTQPPNSANGITTPGTGGGTATAPTTTPSAISPINLTTPGGSSTGNHFGEIPSNASIAGRVWLDRDNDGVIDAGENGIANVTVVLTGTDVNGAAVNRGVQTDANGSYLFDGLLPGTYTVTEPMQPTGTVNGRTVPGSTGGTGTAVGTTPSAISGIVVAAGQASINNHFGELPAVELEAAPFCRADTPFLRYRVRGEFIVPGSLQLRWRNGDNSELSPPIVLNGQALEGELAWPGVVRAADGSTADWPGWVIAPDGRWIEGDDGFTGVRPNAIFEATVQYDNGAPPPAAMAKAAVSFVIVRTVAYPPQAPDCLSAPREAGPPSPDVVVSKSATPTRFATNAAGSYTIRVRNQGQRPTVGEILVRDRLPASIRLTAAPSGAGWACTGAANDDRFECRSSGVIAAGSTSPNVITVPVRVAAGVPNGTTLNNAVMVSGGGEPDFRGPSAAEVGAFNGDVTLLPVCDPTITQNACRTPTVVVQSAALSGSVWYDIGSAIALRDGGDRPLQGWTVELVDPATGRVIATQLTGPDGRYRFADLAPGLPYVVRFREPGGVLWGFPVNGETTPNSPARCDRDGAIAGGTQSSCVRRSPEGITEIEVVLAPGQELVEQSLPVDPSGVVYDAVTRQPVPGSIVTLSPVGACAGYDPAAQVLNAAGGGYRISGSSIAMTVGVDGFYQFVFAPTTPARCTFQLTVTPPETHSFVSTLLPPQPGTLNPPGGPTGTFYVQPQATAPTAVPGTSTQYWLVISSGSTAPNIVHNHLPLDPRVAPGLSISKVGDRQIAEVGDSVLYTLTVRQTAGAALPQLSVLDVLPPGFTYVAGTARVDGVAVADPAGAPGPRLGFTMGAIPAGGQRVLTYRVRVGVGSQQGDGINRATAVGCGQPAGCLVPGTLDPVGGSIVSNRAEYRVRVTGGVFASEACVLGKVFVDCNRNSLQDEEELGIPGVRLYFSDGTFAITDVEGKYSYCGIEPRSATLKVDASTLPRGSALTTSSNRNLGDAHSLFLDLKNGELHRADFIEGSCSNRVLEQVRARRGNGEVRAPESEPAQPGLRFESKPPAAPQQATDGADQPAEQPRARNDGGAL